MHRLPEHEPLSPTEIDTGASESSSGVVRDALQVVCNQVNLTPYQVAEGIYNARVDYLKEIGELKQASDIASEEDLDDHFDDLRRVYQQTCLSLGLAWPPPAIDERDHDHNLDQ